MPKHSVRKPVSDRYAGQQKVRRCLDCRRDFVSTWFGERICAGCKAEPEAARAERHFDGRAAG